MKCTNCDDFLDEDKYFNLTLRNYLDGNLCKGYGYYENLFCSYECLREWLEKRVD